MSLFNVTVTFTNPLQIRGTPEGPALAEIRKLLEIIMSQIDDLKAQVERNTNVEASAVALLQGLKAQLDAAGTDPVALKALSDQLGANNDALAAAIVANTPAAATPAPAAEPPAAADTAAS